MTPPDKNEFHALYNKHLPMQIARQALDDIIDATWPWQKANRIARTAKRAIDGVKK